MSSPYLKQALFENTKLDEVVFTARRTIEDEHQRLSRRHADRRLVDRLPRADRRGRAGPARGAGRLRLQEDQVRLRRRSRDRDGCPRRRLSGPGRGAGKRGSGWPLGRPARPCSRRSGTVWSNDLPGLASEIDGLRHALASGDRRPSACTALVDGGARAIDADAGPHRRSRRSTSAPSDRSRSGAGPNSRAAGIVVSADVLREAVRRDIEALFNTERFESRAAADATSRGGASGRHRPRSTISRRSGAAWSTTACRPSPAGRARDFDREALAREIRAVLATFEPRLKQSATKVTVSIGDKAAACSIEIDGLLIMAPAPGAAAAAHDDRPRQRPGADRTEGRLTWTGPSSNTTRRN